MTTKTTKTTEEHRERVYEGVAEYVTKNLNLLPESISSSKNNMNHVISIATSILLCKWSLEDPRMHGGFVNAILENNLTQTVGSADKVNRECIVFYVLIMSNLGYIQ